MKNLLFAACVLTGSLMAPAVTIENHFVRLELGSNACAKSLVLKATGEELLLPDENVPFLAAVQDRPFHNEWKLIHPNKRTVYRATSLRADGSDRLIVGFENGMYEAVVRVKSAHGYLAFRFEDFRCDRKATYDYLKMDIPPVVSLRMVQLPVKERAKFGNWLNACWDDAAAVAVVGTSVEADIDHEDLKSGRLLFGELFANRPMRGESVALVTGANKKSFLDSMDELEVDYNLPRGVQSRRNPLTAEPIYNVSVYDPKELDEIIAYMKKGGFKLIMFSQEHLTREEGSWATFGNYDLRKDFYPNGLSDVTNLLDRLHAEGFKVGFHTLHSHIGLKSRYVTPVADPRLNKTRRFTLVDSLPATTNDIAEVRVQEPTFGSVTYAPCRVLQFGGELLSYESYSTVPPYRFRGVRRGVHKTRVQAHEKGQIGGILDISEFGSPMSCYLDQNSDLQDEIADKLAAIYNCGFDFVYLDGSEGVNRPFNYNVSRGQYRYWKKLLREPIYGEGAAKTHFDWHFMAGANAFDCFSPAIFKEMLRKYPFAQAPIAEQEMTRVDFGWWGFWAPGSKDWWNQDQGVQADMWEYGASVAAAWNCAVSINLDLKQLKAHPRANDIFETLRRWNDVRRRGLSAEWRAELKDTSHEHHLYRNEKGEYELVRWEMISDGLDPAQPVRAFAFTRLGETYLAYWHTTGSGSFTIDLGKGPETHPADNLRYLKCRKTIAELKERGMWDVGRGRLEVVYSGSDKAVQFAAKELRTCLKGAQGTIRFAEDASLKPQEWRIEGKDGLVTLCGRDGLGQVYAAYAFLEKHAGCRWFAPDTTVIPDKTGWRLPDVSDRGRPAILDREYYVGYDYMDGTWRLRNKETTRVRFDCGLFVGAPFACHTFGWYHDKIKDKLTPEMMGTTASGKPSGQFCPTHPTVRHLVAEQMKAYIREDRAKRAGSPRYTWPTIYELSQDDGDTGGECMCPRCKALYEHAGKRWSGPNLAFVDAVAREVKAAFPEVIVRTFAYSYTELPPRNDFRASDNVSARYCRSFLFQPLTEKTDNGRILKEWDRHLNYKHIWSYWIPCSGPACPAVKPLSDIVDELKFCRDMNVYGYFAQSGGPFGHAFALMQHWLFLKFAEDPDQDVHARAKEFMDAYYGKAAPMMAKYLAYLERREKENFAKVDPKFLLGVNSGNLAQYEQREYLDQTFFETANRLFDAAEQAAAGDEKVLFHIGLERLQVDRTMRRRAPLYPNYRPDYAAAAERTAKTLPMLTKNWCFSQKELPKRLLSAEREIAAARKYPLALPKELAGRAVMQWPADAMAHYSLGGDAVVEDADSTLGFARVFPAQHQKFAPPFFAGAYDSLGRTGCEITLTAEEIPQDEKFHVYKLGTIRVLSPAYTYYNSWHYRSWLSTVGLTGEEREMWISVKFTGPAYVKGSTQPNGVRYERLFYVTPSRTSASY